MAEEQKTNVWPWETAGPTGEFWAKFDDNHGHMGRQFLQVFTADEVAAFPLDASLSQQDMLEQLYTVAKSALAGRSVETAANPELLPREEWLQWLHAGHLLSALESHTKRYEAAEQRMCVENDLWKKRYALGNDADLKVPVSISALSNLAWTYLQDGKPAEAEAISRDLPALLRSTPLLGPGPSPQELGSRRSLMEALAKQGKYEEAKALNEEGYAVIAELAKGKFAKYEQEEIEAMDEAKGNLKIWSAAAVATQV